jgi:hypothetical protein
MHNFGLSRLDRKTVFPKNAFGSIIPSVSSNQRIGSIAHMGERRALNLKSDFEPLQAKIILTTQKTIGGHKGG